MALISKHNPLHLTQHKNQTLTAEHPELTLFEALKKDNELGGVCCCSV
jgi:hypothetical protein